MKLKYEFIYQPVGRTTLAVAVGEAAQDYHGLIQLNDTGAEIMAMMKDDFSIDSLVARLKEEYEAEEAVLRRAVEDLVAELQAEEVLE